MDLNKGFGQPRYVSSTSFSGVPLAAECPQQRHIGKPESYQILDDARFPTLPTSDLLATNKNETDHVSRAAPEFLSHAQSA